jgi:hypothetical protein
MFVIITSWRIVVCERNVGTEVRLQTGTYTAFSAPGQYGPKLYSEADLEGACGACASPPKIRKAYVIQR